MCFLLMLARRKCRARLAQLVERGTFNPKVKGSSPLSGVYHYAEGTMHVI